MPVSVVTSCIFGILLFASCNSAVVEHNNDFDSNNSNSTVQKHVSAATDDESIVPYLELEAEAELWPGNIPATDFRDGKVPRRKRSSARDGVCNGNTVTNICCMYWEKEEDEDRCWKVCMSEGPYGGTQTSTQPYYIHSIPSNIKQYVPRACGGWKTSNPITDWGCCPWWYLRRQ